MRDTACRVPLHVVRYGRDTLVSTLHGRRVEEFAHLGGAHCRQSELQLRKASQTTP